MAEMANANIRINADLLAETKQMAKNVWLSFSNLVSVVLEKIKEEWKIELNLKKESKTQ